MLRFRGVVVPDKQALNHVRFGQTHDDFYYKTWYQVLNRLIDPEKRFRIFLDIKDTRGKTKVAKLQDVLCNANYDFDRSIIESIELVHSHDVALLQLADLLIGAIGYVHRGLDASRKKRCWSIQNRSGAQTRSSLMKAEKFNLFVWAAQ